MIQWSRFIETKGILYRKVTDGNGETIKQLVFPEILKETMLKAFHDQSGHQGLERNELLCFSKEM